MSHFLDIQYITKLFYLLNFLIYYVFQQSLLRQMKTRRVFNTFNQSAVFQEGVRDRARYEKRLEINNKRRELAKAHKEEETSNYFRNIAPLTKLFGAN